MLQSVKFGQMTQVCWDSQTLAPAYKMLSNGSFQAKNTANYLSKWPTTSYFFSYGGNPDFC